MLTCLWAVQPLLQIKRLRLPPVTKSPSTSCENKSSKNVPANFKDSTYSGQGAICLQEADEGSCGSAHKSRRGSAANVDGSGTLVLWQDSIPATPRPASAASSSTDATSKHPPWTGDQVSQHSVRYSTIPCAIRISLCSL